MKCDYCKKDGFDTDLDTVLEVDHLLPRRSNRSYSFDENMTMVHRRCNKKPKWYKRLWHWFKRRVLRR